MFGGKLTVVGFFLLTVLLYGCGSSSNSGDTVPVVDSSATSSFVLKWIPFEKGKIWKYDLTVDDGDKNIHGTGTATVEVLDKINNQYLLHKVEVVNGVTTLDVQYNVQIDDDIAYIKYPNNSLYPILSAAAYPTDFVGYLLQHEWAYYKPDSKMTIYDDRIERTFIQSKTVSSGGHTCGKDYNIKEVIGKNQGITSYSFDYLFACFGVGSSIHTTYLYTLKP